MAGKIIESILTKAGSLFFHKKFIKIVCMPKLQWKKTT